MLKAIVLTTALLAFAGGSAMAASGLVSRQEVVGEIKKADIGQVYCKDSVIRAGMRLDSPKAVTQQECMVAAVKAKDACLSTVSQGSSQLTDADRHAVLATFSSCTYSKMMA